MLASSLAWGDGGTLQFRKPAGNLIVTLFSEPAPLRVGTADLSVMLQNASDNSAVTDGDVKLHLTKPESGRIVELTVPATHAKATNKLLYAASLSLPAAGRWTIEADIKTKEGSGSVAGTLDVLTPAPPLAAHWTLFVLVPLMIALFILNQWLRKKRRLVRRPALS